MSCRNRRRSAHCAISDGHLRNADLWSTIIACAVSTRNSRIPSVFRMSLGGSATMLCYAASPYFLVDFEFGLFRTTTLPVSRAYQPRCQVQQVRSETPYFLTIRPAHSVRGSRRRNASSEAVKAKSSKIQKVEEIAVTLKSCNRVFVSTSNLTSTLI